MDNTEYRVIIFSTVWRHCVCMLIVILIAAILLIMEKRYYKRTKCNQGVTIWEMLGLISFSHKKRFTLYEQMWMKRIVIIICIVVILWQALPACLDVLQEQYVCASGIYHNSCNPSNHDVLSYGSIDFQTNDETLTLELPYDWNTAKYPIGSYYAKIVYGKHSKIIVYVEVISEANVSQGTVETTEKVAVLCRFSNKYEIPIQKAGQFCSVL